MNARAEFKTRRAEASRAALRLAPAFHPHWSSRDDHALMTARAKRRISQSLQSAWVAAGLPLNSVGIACASFPMWSSCLKPMACRASPIHWMGVPMGKRLYTDIEIGGVTYADANAAAAALGVTAGQVRMAVRKGRLDSLGTRPAYRPVTIRGVTYANFSEVGRALGVHANTVRAAYRNGTLHRVGTGRVGPEPMRVQIAGRVFENVHDAAKHFGCCPHTIWSALADGDPDRLARASERRL